MTGAATKPSANNWPGPLATGGNPAPSRDLLLRDRVAEIIREIRPCNDSGKLRVRNFWTGQVYEGEHRDETSARIEASKIAADEIIALIRGSR